MLVVTNVISVFSSFNATISALESYRSDTLSCLFSVFYSSSQWSRWRLRPGALPDSRTPPSLPLFSPSPIYPLHTPLLAQSCLAGCQTAITPDTLGLLFSYFHFYFCLLLPLFLLFPITHFFFLSLCFYSHPVLRYEQTAASVRHIKIEAAENQKVMDTRRHSSGSLREATDSGG